MALLTNKHKLQLAKAYSDLITSGDVYLYVGGITPWTTEASPPSSTDKDGEDIDIWDGMVFCKKVTNKSLVIPRYDYTAGTKYQEYSHDVDLDGLKFYVYSNHGSAHNIWKCISNNSRTAKSGSNEPSLSNIGSSYKTNLQYVDKNLGTATADDGYIWKHMATLTTTEMNEFATTTADTVGGWLPISSSNVVNANKEQATPGEIYHLAIKSPYSFETDSTWSDVLDRVVKIHGDGTDFEGTVKKISSGNYYIDIVNKGSNYFNVDKVEINGSLTHPTLNVPWINILTPIISPIRGHAYDIVEELYASRLMISVDLTETETSFMKQNQFRQVGLIYQPYAFTSGFDNYTVAYGDALGTKFTGGYGTPLYKFTINGFASGHTFADGSLAASIADLKSEVAQTNDFTVTQKNGSTEIAKGKIVEVDNASSATDIYVTFDIGYGNTTYSTTASVSAENLTGHYLVIDNGSGESGSLTYNAVSVPTIKRYTGSILYKANIPPITRQTGSSQKIRLVLEF